MIIIKNLVKKYGNNQVLKDINLEIKTGETVAFLGGNGSGKTTLVELIAGVQEPTSGEIMIDGQKVNTYNEVGIQFQEGNWPKGTTGKSILKFYNQKKFVDLKELIDIFEIKDFLKKDLNNLSGGQKQRFNALLSVVNHPKILILDELITSLDLKMQIKLLNFFKTYQKDNQVTLLVVSHMPEEVELLCDRIIMMEDGKITLDNSLVQVQKKYGSVRNMVIDFFGRKQEGQNHASK